MSVPILDITALQKLLEFLNSQVVSDLVMKVVSLWRESRFQGLYRVEHLHVVLELRDAKGREAVYSKRQQVTFLQNDVFAIQDQAWGDGDIFANYRCSPGIAVDRYEDGFRKRILISLRRARNKGDTDDIGIARTIKQGFTQPHSYFQVQIDHPTKTLDFSVIFPEARLPKSVVVIEENTKRVHPLDLSTVLRLVDGRWQYRWHLDRPRLYSGYIMQWEW